MHRNPPLALRLSRFDELALEAIHDHLAQHHGLRTTSRIVVIKAALRVLAEQLWDAEDAAQRAAKEAAAQQSAE